MRSYEKTPRAYLIRCAHSDSGVGLCYGGGVSINFSSQATKKKKYYRKIKKDPSLHSEFKI